LYTSVY